MTTVMALALVVRVFDRSGLPATDRIAAVRTADAILRQADVAATWVDCSKGSPAVATPSCTRPLNSNELALRITKSPRVAVATAERTLGYSLVEPDAGSGTLATVFSDRVAWLASASHSARPVLLGRAVAHEIGHLLIGTNEHSSVGLMRAVWTADDLRNNRPEDWVFTLDDRTRLHNSRLGLDDSNRIAAASLATPMVRLKADTTRSVESGFSRPADTTRSVESGFSRPADTTRSVESGFSRPADTRPVASGFSRTGDIARPVEPGFSRPADTRPVASGFSRTGSDGS